MAITEAYTGTQTVQTTEWSMTASAARPVLSAPARLVNAQAGLTGNITATPSPSPTAGRLQIFCIVQNDAGTLAAPSTPSGGGGDWTWQALPGGNSRATTPTAHGDVTVFIGSGTTVWSGNLTCTLGTGHDSYVCYLYEVPGGGFLPTIGLSNKGSSLATSLSFSIGTLADGSMSFAVFGIDNGGGTGMTARAGWTQLDTADDSAAAGSIEAQYKLVGEGTASATWNSTYQNCGVAFEILLPGGQAATAAGVYQAFVDLNALAGGDVFEWRLYEKTASGSTQRLVTKATFGGPQGVPVWYSPPFALKNGWDMTLVKLSGTDRSIDWSIRKVA